MSDNTALLYCAGGGIGDSLVASVVARALHQSFAKVAALTLEAHRPLLERVPDIEEYLQAADLGLFASDSESFCLSILEAMCFGCPSVATRVGGIPEVVEDGISGLLVPPGDAAGLARAVEALIADPTRRAAMGAAARRRAMDRFSADVIVPGYEAIYRRVCQT